jgi:hypothetical protein
MLNISGLWIHESKDGSKYMAGNLSQGIRILVFKNTSKRPGSNDPDYQLCFAPNEKPKKQQANESPKEDIPF